MNVLRTLRASVPDERKRWLEYWVHSGREPFGHPGYAELFCGPDEEAICIAAESGEFMPFIVRRVAGIAPAGKVVYDAVSPYGYGGPFGVSGPNRHDFFDALASWVQDSGFASLYGRLSLEGAMEMRAPSWQIKPTSENVRIDLSVQPEELLRSYAHKVRKNIKKAMRHGCTVESSASLNLREFLDVYHGTMRRRSAASHYFFGESFFKGLSELPINSSFYTVRDANGRAVSVEVVLRSETCAYSFLGGTVAEAFPMAPNDLLKHQVAVDSSAESKRWYVLGGGYEPDDGIFRYKRSFAPSGIVPYFTLRVMGDRALYGALHGPGRVAELDVNASLDAEYFPTYRS